MSEPVLQSAREGAKLELRLNRPASKNALDAELVEALGEALERAGSERELRVIVLAGSGGAFCSGVDLRSAAADLSSEARLSERIDGFQRLVRAVVRAPQPVIAQVDGPAVGFGADLAFACDLRVCSTRAYFEQKFAALALMPDGGGSFLLQRLIGFGRALEHLLLGTRFDAEQALALGIANRVVAPEALAEETTHLATRLAHGPPLAFAAIKRALREASFGSFEEALEREKRGQLALLQSADAREAISAFLERRAPEFRGA